MDPRNAQYMFYGLAAAWVILSLYAVSLVARERKIQDELRRLRALLEDRERH